MSFRYHLLRCRCCLSAMVNWYSRRVVATPLVDIHVVSKQSMRLAELADGLFMTCAAQHDHCCQEPVWPLTMPNAAWAMLSAVCVGSMIVTNTSMRRPEHSRH